MQKYPLGSTIRMKARLMDDDDVQQSGAGIRLLILPPGSATSSIISCSIGSDGWAVADYVPTTAGVYKYRFENTVSPVAAKEKQFLVEDRGVPAP